MEGVDDLQRLMDRRAHRRGAEGDRRPRGRAARDHAVAGRAALEWDDARDGDEEPIEVVASVGPLDAVVVLLREFLHRSGAVRAVAVVDRAPGEGPAVVDCARLLPIEVDFGDARRAPPPRDRARRRAADAARRAPAAALRGRRRRGREIAAPLGGRRPPGRAVRDLAAALGGRNVAMAQFATNDPDAPLAITARADGSEPIVLALGEEEFPMEDDR